MAITKQKKVELSGELDTLLKDATTMVFVHFKKLPVSETMALRRSLRSENVGYKVIKKTLLKRVLDTKGIQGELVALPGEIAIAFGTDALAPARGIYEFAKTHKEQIEIIGGVFEGTYFDQSQMLGIATIPPRDVLLSQIAFLLKSPLQRLAIAVNEVAKTKNA